MKNTGTTERQSVWTRLTPIVFHLKVEFVKFIPAACNSAVMEAAANRCGQIFGGEENLSIKFPMTSKPMSNRFTLIAGITSLTGPVGAVLSETGHLRFSLDSPLSAMWGLAAIAAVGVVIGILAVWKGARAAGIVCILTNLVVLVLYGFIASYFALGNSR